jgi:hypothetical protein
MRCSSPLRENDPLHSISLFLIHVQGHESFGLAVRGVEQREEMRENGRIEDAIEPSPLPIRGILLAEL